MLKDYIRNRGISLYQLSKDSGVPYSTISDLANSKVAAGNCKASVIARLASTLQISMEELLAICDQPITIQTDHGAVTARTYARNRNYYVSFLYKNTNYELQICPVCKEVSPFLSDLTEWTVDNFLADQQLEELANELLHHAKK
ncbi:MAG: helix-turn-helix domain-containing protein [Lachnospiraceae bacterium]|nr:helix-turn-helix domain-containing protein [Lachnospiraceae bacterium]